MKSFIIVTLLSLFTIAAKGQASVMVADIYAGSKPGQVGHLANQMTGWKGKLYFIGHDSAHGAEQWSYDEKSAPKMIADLNPGIQWGVGGAASYSPDFVEFKGKLYMKGDNGATGEELFSYDGLKSPALVANIAPGSYSSLPQGMFTFGGKLFFAADIQNATSSAGYELYIYDTTAAPRRIVINDGSNPIGSYPSYFFTYGSKLYFSACPQAKDFKLYTVDIAGVYTLAPGASGFTDPGPACVTQGKVYFSAVSATHGRELWSYDGSIATRLTDLMPGTGAGLGGPVTQPVYFNGKVYFAGHSAAGPYLLYTYDPATSAVVAVTGVDLGSEATRSKNVFDGFVYKDALYFTAYAPASGIELWRGDASGFALYADIIPGTDSSFFSAELGSPLHRISPAFTEFNGNLYFKARDKALGTELWRIGTVSPNGVQAASWEGEASLRPNPAGSVAYIDMSLQAGQRLYIALSDAAGKCVYQTPAKSYAAGKHTMPVPVNSLAAGQYFYRVLHQDGRQLAAGALVRQ